MLWREKFSNGSVTSLFQRGAISPEKCCSPCSRGFPNASVIIFSSRGGFPQWGCYSSAAEKCYSAQLPPECNYSVPRESFSGQNVRALFWSCKSCYISALPREFPPLRCSGSSPPSESCYISAPLHYSERKSLQQTSLEIYWERGIQEIGCF